MKLLWCIYLKLLIVNLRRLIYTIYRVYIGIIKPPTSHSLIRQPYCINRLPFQNRAIYTLKLICNFNNPLNQINKLNEMNKKSIKDDD